MFKYYAFFSLVLCDHLFLHHDISCFMFKYYAFFSLVLCDHLFLHHDISFYKMNI